MMKTYVTLLIALSVLSGCKKQSADEKPPYKNPNLTVDERVNDLLGRMTVQEKIRQLDMYWGKEVANMDAGGHESESFSREKARKYLGDAGAGSVHDLYPLRSEISNEIQKYLKEETRLGIPAIIVEEGLHGLCRKGSTSFPIPLNLSAAFDTALVRRVGRAIAEETRAHGIHMLFAPVLDLARDPRWGRVEETYGEDPYLNGLCGVAMVKGFQGRSIADDNAIIAEPKHFGIHSVPEAGSNMATVNMGEREARTSFLYVFEKAVRDGGAMGIMGAYHATDGIPCVVNKWMLTDVLRNEWGFKGFVVSDLAAMRWAMNQHFVATDTADILSQAIKAGMNMQFYDFSHESFERGIAKALDEKLLTEEDLNRAVAEVLRAKFMLGLFENPYVDTTLVAKQWRSEEHVALALEAAQKSICLLKNEKNTLPITGKVKRIAVVGPLATSTYVGGYSEKTVGVPILDGIKQNAGENQKVTYAQGYEFGNSIVSAKLTKDAVELARNSDVVVVVLGEDLKIIGENKDRAHLDLDEDQMNMVKAVCHTGKPVVAVLFNGRPLTINWVAENVPAIIEGWFAGEKGGQAIGEVLFGKINPSGRLPISFPRSTGQIPFYYNHMPMNHHVYVDEKNTPLFSFGHGLSYTTFEYSNLKVSPLEILPDGKAMATLTVRNTGTVEGSEVVQLYIRDVIGSVTTPILGLKGFQRISLKPGESTVVSFEILPEHLSLWNREMKRVVEPGEFKIMAGSSSVDIRDTTMLFVTQPK